MLRNVLIKSNSLFAPFTISDSIRIGLYSQWGSELAFEYFHFHLVSGECSQSTHPGRPTQSDGAGWQLFTVWTLAATHMRDHLHRPLYIAMMDQILYLQVKPNMKHLGHSGRHCSQGRNTKILQFYLFYYVLWDCWPTVVLHSDPCNSLEGFIADHISHNLQQ